MNILVLDYFPLTFSAIATLYSFAQAWRWADSGNHRWMLYGWLACFGICTITIALVQVEALHLHDLQQSQTLSADCMTDYECEQLELAQGEAEDNE